MPNSTLFKFKHSLRGLVIICTAVSLVVAAAFPTAVLAEKNDGCPDIDLIWARGSGQGDGLPEEKGFFVSLQSKLAEAYDKSQKESPKISEYQIQYPAVPVSDSIDGLFNSLGAKVSAGQANAYGKSVLQGRKDLMTHLSEKMDTCQDHDIKFILGGYSQGAQVMSDSLSEIASKRPDIESRIIYVALFGDPKLHLPEGEGLNPPACRNEGLSWYRVNVPNCDTDNGVLGARKPFTPSGWERKNIGLWCNDNDFICGSSKNLFNNDGHMQYLMGKMQEMAGKVVKSLASSLDLDSQALLELEKDSATRLIDLNPFKDEMGLDGCSGYIDSCYWNQYVGVKNPSSAPDSFSLNDSAPITHGYKYHFPFCGNNDGIVATPQSTFLLEGKYTKISGTSAITLDTKNTPCYGTTTVYGDGKKLGEWEVGKGILPQKFVLDIKGIKELTIAAELYSYNEKRYSHMTVAFDEMLLYE